MTASAPLKLTHAMVLAAGFGERMRPITETIPKPLVQVAGRTLLDRTLDHLAAAGLEKVVVNSHYLGEQVEAAAGARTDLNIHLSPEPEILETGGGVLNALAHLGDGPFLALNSDALWGDGAVPTLTRMAEIWDGERMDALLLVYSTVRAVGYGGRGDFFLDVESRLHRRLEGEVAPFLFTGIQILHPRLFEGLEVGKWSLNRVYDIALSRDRLFGLRHDGDWYHVGTPEGLKEVDDIFRNYGRRVLYF